MWTSISGVDATLSFPNFLISVQEFLRRSSIKSPISDWMTSFSLPLLINAMIGVFLATDNCVTGSPILCAAIVPIISPGSTTAPLKLLMICLIISSNLALFNLRSCKHILGAKNWWRASSNTVLLTWSSLYFNESLFSLSSLPNANTCVLWYSKTSFNLLYIYIGSNFSFEVNELFVTLSIILVKLTGNI